MVVDSKFSMFDNIFEKFGKIYAETMVFISKLSLTCMKDQSFEKTFKKNKIVTRLKDFGTDLIFWLIYITLEGILVRLKWGGPGRETPPKNFWGCHRDISTPDFQRFNVHQVQVHQIGSGVAWETARFPISEARCLQISNSAKHHDRLLCSEWKERRRRQARPCWLLLIIITDQ